MVHVNLPPILRNVLRNTHVSEDLVQLHRTMNNTPVPEPHNQRWGAATCLAVLLGGMLLLGGVLALNPVLVGPLIQSPYKTMRSPDDSWELILTAGEAWIFGPHPLTAYRRQLPCGIPLPLFTFEIANDGAVLHDDLCNATWPHPTVAELTCTGAEQEPARYRIDLRSGRVETASP